MKILIVGGGSIIAQSISSRVRDMAEVKFAGRREADYLLDLAQPNRLPEIPEMFDLVINAAADFGGNSDMDFLRAELVNAAGSLSVCALARKVGAKRLLLISSTSATYQQGDAFYGIYGLSKRHGEEAAQLFCYQNDIALTILRPTQVYDAKGECRNHQELFYSMADRAEAGNDIPIYGTNDAIRNYIYLNDLVEVCYRVIERECEGTFVVANPVSVKLSEVAQAAFDAFDKGGSVRFLAEHEDIPDLPPVGELDLYRIIDFRPSVGIQEGMRRISQHRELVS